MLNGSSDNGARPGIAPDILNEAADWLVRLHSGDATEQDHMELAGWCRRSPAHAEAWRRAEGMLNVFRQVPQPVGRATLSRLQDSERRRMLRLGLYALLLPIAGAAAASLPWREWNADYQTATGERRSVQLADGTRLVLDTASAVDVSFTAGERRLTLLAGEIMVSTGHDPSPASRPFIVQTAQGTLRPLGTRFTLREAGKEARAAVYEGAVEIRPAHADRPVILRAGERAGFTAAEVRPIRPVEGSADLWERGMLLARNMPLGELVAELARYHRGVLRCDPAVAGIAVSGAFPLTDTRASLDLLEKTLPIRIGGIAPYWLSVQAL